MAGGKTGMACLHVKLCVAISECFGKCIWYLKALYKNVQVYLTRGLLQVYTLCLFSFDF